MLAALGFQALATTSSGFAFTLGRVTTARPRWTRSPTCGGALRGHRPAGLRRLENGYGAEPSGAEQTIPTCGRGRRCRWLDRGLRPVRAVSTSLPHAVERVAAAVEAARRARLPVHAHGPRREPHRATPTWTTRSRDCRRTRRRCRRALRAWIAHRGRDPRRVRGGREAGERARLRRPDVRRVADAGAQRVSVGGALTWSGSRCVHRGRDGDPRPRGLLAARLGRERAPLARLDRPSGSSCRWSPRSRPRCADGELLLVPRERQLRRRLCAPSGRSHGRSMQTSARLFVSSAWTNGSSCGLGRRGCRPTCRPPRRGSCRRRARPIGSSPSPLATMTRLRSRFAAAGPMHAPGTARGVLRGGVLEQVESPAVAPESASNAKSPASAIVRTGCEPRRSQEHEVAASPHGRVASGARPRARASCRPGRGRHRARRSSRPECRNAPCTVREPTRRCCRGARRTVALPPERVRRRSGSRRPATTRWRARPGQSCFCEPGSGEDEGRDRDDRAAEQGVFAHVHLLGCREYTGRRHAICSPVGNSVAIADAYPRTVDGSKQDPGSVGREDIWVCS